MKVVLATRNQGKIREFQKRFSEIGWEVIPYRGYSGYTGTGRNRNHL